MPQQTAIVESIGHSVLKALGVGDLFELIGLVVTLYTENILNLDLVKDEISC